MATDLSLNETAFARHEKTKLVKSLRRFDMVFFTVCAFVGLDTLGIVGSLVTSGAVWMIGSDRIQAVAAYDGAFLPFFGVFNRKLGTPVRVNVLSGVVSSVFCIVAVAAFNGGDNAKFQVVLDIAISTTLLSRVTRGLPLIRASAAGSCLPKGTPFHCRFGMLK